MHMTAISNRVSSRNGSILRTTGIFLAITIMGFLTSCGSALISKPAGESLTVTLLHVNDTHSHLDAIQRSVVIDNTKTYIDIGGYGRLYRKISQLRATKANTLLLHAGDAVQGTLYFTRYQGKADFAALNMLEIDAMTLGNHEFDGGPDALVSFLDMADFPLISANVDANDESLLAGRIPEYMIKNVGSEQIAIIGLTAPETAYISKPGSTIHFNDVNTTAQKIINELKDENINKIILLTHIGYGADIRLAREVDGIDVIVGGHSHTLLGDFTGMGLASTGPYPTKIIGPSGDPVYVVQAWKWANALGVLNVAFDDAGIVSACFGIPVILAGEPFQQKNADGEKAPVTPATRDMIYGWIAAAPGIEAVEPAQAMQQKIAPYRDGIKELNTKTIGYAKTDLPHIRIPGTHASGAMLDKGSLLAALFCDAMLWQARQVGTHADLCIQNAGIVRGSLPAGKITVGAVYSLLPFGTTLFVNEMTGADVKKFLEQGLTSAIDKDIEGAFPYVAGIRYTANANRPPGDRITSLEINNNAAGWRALHKGTAYRVVLNSYIANGGDGYPPLQTSGSSQYDTGFVDAEVFMDYISKKRELLQPENTGVTYLP